MDNKRKEVVRQEFETLLALIGSPLAPVLCIKQSALSPNAAEVDIRCLTPLARQIVAGFNGPFDAPMETMDV